MYSLITFATQWGSKYGGINSFNTDFLKSFGIAYHLEAKVICIVASATDDEIEDAHDAYISLVSLPFPPQEKIFSKNHAIAGIDQLKKSNTCFDPGKTIWLGHDRITGAAAIEAAEIAGGRSALIHHMSYADYESYAENSHTAYKKQQEQIALFRQADIALAIGPLLRDALHDLVSGSKGAYMLIPGLAEIVPKPAPKTFTAFLSGRLSDDAARIKQGHLGIAAFAKACCNARIDKMPNELYQKPKLVLRGVDFESILSASPEHTINPENELKEFAQEYAGGVINLHALPYTQNRQELYNQLSVASVALMPSWHEGFGLTAWEAIAAGVPLIISEDSGVYRLLEEEFYGAGTGAVYPIKVDGLVKFPYFSDDDLKQVASALKEIASNIGGARNQAGILRSLVDKYTWPNCAEKAAEFFEWPLQKGSIPEVTLRQKQIVPNNSATPTDSINDSPLQMPSKRWQAGGMVADSQLLRAEEGLVPFDSARQPDLDNLNAWLDDTRYSLAVRLVTGVGGLGKTRLALELCQQRLKSNWHVGILDTDLEPKDMPSAWLKLRSFNKPLLIVIDYAETRQIALLSLIKVMLNDIGNQSARLLLLARDSGEWWDNLPGKDQACESFLNSYATTGPHRLPSLHTEIQERRQAYLSAIKTFSEILQVTTPTPTVVPELVGEHFDRPLYLQMAALLALHGERPTTAQGLTKALLNHERRYWRGALADSKLFDPDRYAEQLLALTTLAGGFPTAKAAQDYWNKASEQSISTADFN